MILVFDTETSGEDKALNIAQIGAILYSTNWHPIVEANLIIVPNELDLSYNSCIGIKSALLVFDRLYSLADKVAGHNVHFDIDVLNRTFVRHDILQPVWFRPNVLCTMNLMTHECRLGGGVDGNFKWPTLQEAYTFCFGKPFTGAHDAMADVRACAAVYRWYEEKYATKNNEPRTA